MSLNEKESVEKNPMTNIRQSCVRIINHPFQQVAVVIDGWRGEDAAPQEKEAHPKIENSMKFFSSPNFPH